jgi:hypothetical protein
MQIVIFLNYLESFYLAQSVIVCPTNNVANAINEVILSRVPGVAKGIYSCHTICWWFGFIVPSKFVHAAVLGNLSHYQKVSLKVGVPIIPLRKNQSMDRVMQQVFCLSFLCLLFLHVFFHTFAAGRWTLLGVWRPFCFYFQLEGNGLPGWMCCGTRS